MRRRLLAVLAAAILCCAGVVSAALAAGAFTTGTVSACATTPGQTLADNGTPIYTVAAATNCTTTTYTVPTDTVTVTTTVAGTTTTPITTTTPAASYLFDDEFNGVAGSKPSSTIWNAKATTMSSGVHMDGWTNISEDGVGDLVITASKDSSGVWHSGFLTGNVGGFSFGGSPYDVQARAEVACGVGTWSSPIWTWGAPYGAAPSIENDVIEHLDGKEPDGYHATLHNWNGSGNPQNGHLVPTILPLCLGFHTYEAKVYADHVDYYFDGTLEAIATASSVGLTNLLASKQVANVSLNLGGWAGTPTLSGPVSLLVDYVRVSRLP